LAGTAESDVVIDPGRQRRARRQAFMRVGLPIAGVAVVIAALAAIAWHSVTTNRRDALDLADEVIRAQEQRIMREVESFLGPAPRILELLRGVLSDGAFLGPAQGAAEALGWQALFDNPQIALVSYARPDGSFMMVRREASGALDTKVIEHGPEGRATTWTRRDRQGNTVAIEADPDDTYDPRERVWYRGALEAGDALAWSSLYIFFTDQRPGVTVSRALRGEDGGVRAVFGADVALESLSAFLSRLEIGRNGRAVIVDTDGMMIAHADPARTFRRFGDTLEPLPVGALDDPAVVRAYNRLRVEGPGRRMVEVDGGRYLTAATPIAAAGRGWAALIVVPEADFVGFVALNNRSTIAMSAAIVLMVALFAAVLARQGLRADRAARMLVEREDGRAAQSSAFAALTAEAAILDPERPDALRVLTRVVARVTVARRAGVWLRIGAGEGEAVRLEDCRDREHDGHTGGLVVARRDASELFAALDVGDDTPIMAQEAAREPRLAEFHARCLAPLGTRAAMVVPMRSGSDWIGFLCLEDWSADGVPVFARAAAGLLAVRYGAASRDRTVSSATPPPVRSDDAAAAAPADLSPPVPARAGRRTLLAAAVSTPDGPVRLFEQVCVLTLVATDAAALAEAASGEGRRASALERLAAEAARVAGRRALGYAKLSGDRFVLAAGFAPGSAAAAAVALAEAALDLRDQAATVFAGLGHSAAFRLGLDCGPALGAEIAAGEPVFNLWGDAVRLSERLAETGLPGAIAVSQSAHAFLRGAFVFQPRGTFYQAGAGEIAIYLLAGRE
jgi:class 3 adenylate cyclase